MTETKNALQHVLSEGDDGTDLSSELTVFPTGLVTTTQIPSGPDGSIDGGDITSQSRQTLRNLEVALASVGATLADVAHLTIYLTDIAERTEFNQVYREMFTHPYPVRCAVGVAALARPEMKVEVTALAFTGSLESRSVTSIEGAEAPPRR